MGLTPCNSKNLNDEDQECRGRLRNGLCRASFAPANGVRVFDLRSFASAWRPRSKKLSNPNRCLQQLGSGQLVFSLGSTTHSECAYGFFCLPSESLFPASTDQKPVDGVCLQHWNPSRCNRASGL